MRQVFIILISFMPILGQVTTSKVISIFGIKLGAPIELPQCVTSDPIMSIVLPSDHDCFQVISTEKQANEYIYKTIAIRFRTDDKPAVISGYSVMGSIINGRVESIRFSTNGISNQEFVLAELEKKFGPPKDKKISKKTNLYGAEFDVISARWSNEELIVEFDGVDSKINSGSVRIYTKIGFEIYSKILRDILKDKNPL